MTAKTQNTANLNEDALNAIMAAEIIQSLEPSVMDVGDVAEALAEANGASQALADQAAAAAQAPEEDANQAAVDDGKPFAELFDAVSDATVGTTTQTVIAGFAERAQFELDADAQNTNIQKTLTKLQKGLTPGVVRALVVAKTDTGYMNKSEVSGKRRNVYALEKLKDVLYGAVTGHPQNAINKAVLSSMIRLKDVGLPFTAAVAKACASDKVAVENHYKPHLVRHTVAESTASTQQSSTMTALEDLGVVVNTGTRQFPIYEMTKTPLAVRLEEVVRTKLLAPAVAA